MDDWMEKYRGAEVEVHYLTDNNMFQDKGMLTDFGDRWIELLKPTGRGDAETFLIPVSAVRLVKVRALADKGENRLLRPANPL
jgi:hypothetical protein